MGKYFTGITLYVFQDEDLIFHEVKEILWVDRLIALIFNNIQLLLL